MTEAARVHTGGWGKFCRQRSLELSRADWVAGMFGALVRSVSFAKGSQERDLAMCLEHALFLLIAVVIVVCSLAGNRTYSRLRTVVALVVRFKTIGDFANPASPGSYIWLRPVLQSAAGKGGGGGSQAWGSSAFSFAVKLLLASRAFFLWFLPLVLPLPLHWALAAQPLLLVLIVRQNAALCSLPALLHPRAQAWLRNASGLLRLAAFPGAPGLPVSFGRECQACVLWLQLSMGLVAPLWLVLRRESHRFAEWAAAERSHTLNSNGGGGAGCSTSHRWVQCLLVAGSWSNGREWRTARRATLAVVLCGMWIVISVVYS